MRLTSCLIILILLFVVASTSRRSLDHFGSSSDRIIMSTRYSNTWALKIKFDGEISHRIERANDIAKDNGLVNKGLIGELKNVFLFELLDGPQKEMSDMTEALKKSANVVHVEQQTYVHHVPKN